MAVLWPSCARDMAMMCLGSAWELAGGYPKILNDAVVGEQARALFADANDMLDKIVSENWLEAKARFVLFGNTIVLRVLR